MLKEQAKTIKRLVILLDIALIIISFKCSYALISEFRHLPKIDDFLLILVLFLMSSLYLFNHFGLYSSIRFRSSFEIFLSICKTYAISAVVVAAGIYLYKPEGLSRGFFGLFLAYSFVLIAMEKLSVKLFLVLIRKKGYNYRNVLIVGTGKKSSRFANHVLAHPELGIRLAGFLQEPNDPPSSIFLGYPVLAPLEDLVNICKTHTVDEVVFCLSKNNIHIVESYLHEMEELGIIVRMTMDFYRKRRSKHDVTLFMNEIPVMTFYRLAFNPDALFLKRCLDVLGAVVGLAITAVLLPFIALAVAMDSPGPIFFKQKRVGENGRLFTCWKFRSMVTDAEVVKQQLVGMNDVTGAMFKMKNDPRVTEVGKILRKYSLDELPQFWNVLRGEMSLVGTRPPTPDEVVKYENWQRRRICIKPGITGLWQVSGRNEIKNFDEIVKLDLEYVDNWTLMFDIKLLLKTLKVMVVAKGAH